MRQFCAFATFCLLCVLGTTCPSYAQLIPPMGSNPIAPTNWGFQCSLCGVTGQWITTTSQPETVRLWDSLTNWSVINTAPGQYDWSVLDTWLDLIAEHKPGAVIYTFGHTPCWISSIGCDGKGWGSGHSWSPGPPSDLTASGSVSFDAFVKALTQHCSPAGNCVKDYIKYWEMWNEANQTSYWTGTAQQLYNMFKPVIAIIRDNVPGAIVSTPPVCAGDAPWMTKWMILENNNSRLSDYYGFHVYLLDLPPETRMKLVRRMLKAKNTNGWTTTPWMNTETGFRIYGFTCSPHFTKKDCQGQLVRWHVMQYAYQAGAGGAFNVGWFNWDTSILDKGYDTYYYTMMQWLTGATFTVSCTSTQQDTLWTCPLTEADGKQALIVWNAAGDSQYTPGTQYADYKYFNGTFGGATQPIPSGQVTEIGVQPIMFETAH